MHLSIREIYASRDASCRLTNRYGRGQKGGVGKMEKEEGRGVGLSTDRIINEIRKAGLETSLTLSQCNIALESIFYNNRNKYNNKYNNHVVREKRRNDTNRRKT